MEGVGINMLPEGCVSTILSFTSISDAFNSSTVSSTFRSAAESDLIWERFLPSDYHEIVSKSVNPLTFSSKKELYLRLCSSILIDDGLKSFKLDKSTGKKSYTLSARDLSITWSDNPLYWAWNSSSNSRFPEVAELRTISWLEIQGKIRTQTLSPNTKYGAYLVIKITDRSYGLDSIPSEISIEVGNNQVRTGTAYLSQRNSAKNQMQNLFYGNRTQIMKSRIANEGGDPTVPVERKDGWLEIELGEFFSGDQRDDQEVKMCLKEVKGYQLKGGVVVQGIEVRPK